MSRAIPRTQALAERAFMALDRFLHIEAMSGIVLLVTTVIALLWANSSYADLYHAVWHTEVALTIGSLQIGQSLHFLINDGLMTIFFLVVFFRSFRELRGLLLPTSAQTGSGSVGDSTARFASACRLSRGRCWFSCTASV